MRLHILAVGRNKGALAELFADYAKRLNWTCDVREIDAPRGLSGEILKRKEAEKLAALLPDKAFVVALDERGKDLGSEEFAAKLRQWQERSGDIAFILGGADGLSEELRQRADFILGLGRKTWPHMLARVMLMEQIYRAQQILAGHPYHRA